MILEKYSFGIGDRFGCQGKALLEAIIKSRESGIEIVPVWNKSFREHSIIGTIPEDVRREANEAVLRLGWEGSFYVDADHINLSNVDAFINCSDYFTIDVADSIGKRCDEGDIDLFIKKCERYIGNLEVDGLNRAFEITKKRLCDAACRYLAAVKEAVGIYRYIAARKGEDNFVTEISFDEADEAQSPLELFFILAALGLEEIKVQAIAPKFVGRFNKGVDYVGDVGRFEEQFREDLAVISCAKKKFDLPQNLKLSIHSGSDKFSIYVAINKALKDFDAGLHIKTAGTTWLEELGGLAESGGEGLAIAKEIYQLSLENFEDLCRPYVKLTDIDQFSLPEIEKVTGWDGRKFVGSLQHNQDCPDYNRHFRQLLHLSYKIAANMGERFFSALKANKDLISKRVTKNIYERHIRPIFREL